MGMDPEAAARRAKMLFNIVSAAFLVAGIAISAMLFQIPGVGGLVGSIVLGGTVVIALIIMWLGRRVVRGIREAGYAGGSEVVAALLTAAVSFAYLMLASAHAQIAFTCDQNTVNTLNTILSFASLLGIFIYVILALFGMLGLFFSGLSPFLREIFALQAFSVMITPLIFWAFFLFGLDRAINVQPPQQTGTAGICQINVNLDQGPIAFRLLGWFLKPVGLWPQ
ncbi:MAG: hypothetical protein QXE01_03930 [Sulfolobales archaeon]